MSDENPAWDELFELLGPIHDDVQLFARRIAGSNAEGDDAFQEAVLRAARKLHALRERARFRAWMCSIVVSVHRSRCRRAFWTRWVSHEDAHAEPIGEDGASWADERASARRAAAALATLAAPQREAIVLFELQGYAIDEIAEIQRTSISAVKSRLARGRDRLRAFYRSLASPGFAGARSNAQRCGEAIASPGFAGARSNAQRCGEAIASPTVMPTEEVCRGRAME